MIASIKKWLAPPVFEGDETKTRRASFLNLAILITLSFLGLMAFASLVEGTIRAGISLTLSFLGFMAFDSFVDGTVRAGISITLFVLFFVALLLYYWLRHGKVALAGSGLIILVFLASIILEIINGTVRAPATLGYLLVIITAGMLFEWRGTLLSVSICSLALLGMILVENADMLPQSVHNVTLANWITYMSLFGVIGLVSLWGQQTTKQALGRADLEIKTRQHVEMELRKLTQAVEQSPASIVITDLDGNIEYVNPRFTQVTGYTSDEALGKNPRILKTDLTPPETHPQLWQTIAQGKEWHGEFVNRKKDGTLYYESAIISPITGLHGSATHYLAVKEDITERKQVEAALIETALEREAALEKASKYKLELETQNEEEAKRAAELVIANQELTFQHEEKAKRAAELVIANQELTFQNEEKAKRAAELVIANQELTFQHEEKTKRAAELVIANQELTFQHEEKTKRAAELVIANQELTFQNEEKAKQAAEFALVNSYLENLINYANAPIIVWDQKFCITRFNHAFEFLTGHTETDMLGQSLEILFPAALVNKTMAQIRKTLIGERWESVEIKILHRDASVRTVLWNSATLFEPDGKTALATIAQGQDITRRKQVEDALKNTNLTLKETAVEREAALAKLKETQIELRLQNDMLLEKQAEIEALRERYFDLYDLAPVGYCTLNPEGLILEANLSAANLLGVTRESMLKASLTRFIAKNSQDQYYFHQKKFIETGTLTLTELQLVKQDGTIFWAQVESSLLRVNKHEPQARILISDISPRKQIEKLLQDAEQRLSTLAEYSRAITWEVDAEGLYTYISPTCLSILGYSPEEIVGQKHFYDLHPEEGRAAFKAGAFEYFKNHDSFRNLENILQASDERIIWFSTNALPILDEDGKLTGYRGVDTDINERKQIEQALAQAVTRLALAVRAGGVGTWEYDFVNDRLTWDDQMYKLYGISPQDFSGAYDAWQKGLHPQDREHGDNEIQAARRAEKDFDTEFRVVWPDGSVHALRALALVMRDETGEALSMLGTNWDVTDQKLMLKKLQISIFEKDALLREVHHRVKNNLAAIIGLINLQESNLIDPVTKTAFSELGSRVSAMALVHELLYSSENLAQIDLQTYLERLTSQLSHLYQSSGQAQITVAAQGVFIDLDEAIPCGLIVSEQITNSFKYAFPGGQPRAGETICEIKISASQKGSAYTLNVCDNGVGVPAGFDWKKSPTLGMSLIRMLGEHQLGATIQLDTATGTCIEIKFDKNNRRNR